jgi:anti-anti-sigma regulatory factor
VPDVADGAGGRTAPSPAGTRCRGRLPRLAGAGLSDHACWAYYSATGRAAAAVTWLADGLRLGQRAVYIADLPPADLAADLAGLPGRAAALDRGALVVRPAADVHDMSGPVDAEHHLGAYAEMVDRAIADGFAGARVAADITPLVADPGWHAAHLTWEQVADRYMTDHPLAPVCLYDARRVSGIDAIICAHPLRGPSAPPFSLHGAGPTRAALAGEVDGSLALVLAELLARQPVTDRVLDLSGLSFLDVRCARILHRELAGRRRAAQEVVLSGASPAFRRLWDACGFGCSFLVP